MAQSMHTSEQAMKTITSFFAQFKSDIYTKIVLEEFFKEIMNGKSLSIHDKNRYEGHEDINCNTK